MTSALLDKTSFLLVFITNHFPVAGLLALSCMCERVAVIVFNFSLLSGQAGRWAGRQANFDLIALKIMNNNGLIVINL